MKRIIAIILVIMMIVPLSALTATTSSAAKTYFNVEAINDGFDIYTPVTSSGYAYRYGASVIINDDGSYDMWFSCKGSSASDVLDYISYKHSPDGKTFESEKICLSPTPHSQDYLSCCDPGVVYFGGYYYLGYTSTLDRAGYSNNLFVARSKNPDGPYEKWNGTGWGGYPEAIVKFQGSGDQWGIGEPSFVEVNGTLYIYYTLRSEKGFYTMSCTADATDPNWPATMNAPVKALNMSLTSQSSSDIKYDEASGMFIAVGLVNVHQKDSYIAVYTSWDGLTFTESDRLYKNIIYYAGNEGLSGTPNGHIRPDLPTYITYAYGTVWGHWATRMAPLKITYSTTTDFSDSVENLTKISPSVAPKTGDYIGITTAKPSYYIKNVNSSPFTVTMYKFDENIGRTQITDTQNIIFSNYDTDVCTFDGNVCTPKGIGRTMVSATYFGLYYEFEVEVRANGVSTSSSDLIEWYPFQSQYYIQLDNSDMAATQIRGIGRKYSGLIGELFNDPLSKAVFKPDEYNVTYSNYDTGIISVTATGDVYPVSIGTTPVTVTVNNTYTFTVTVNVVNSPLQKTVSLNPNGGTCSTASVKTNYGWAYGKLPIPERSGYTFLGWYSNDRLITCDTVFELNSPVSLTAKWQLNSDSDKVRIIYNSNGGVNAPAAQTVTLGSLCTLTSSVPEKKGYVFLGWSSKIYGDVEYSVADSITADRDITLYAQWMINPIGTTRSYFTLQPLSLRYYAVSTAQENIAVPASNIVSTTMFYTGNWGYFTYGTGAGWGYLADSATAEVFGLMFNLSNGGVGNISNIVKIKGTKCNIPTALPTREGYRFLGWSADINAKIPTYLPGSLYEANEYAFLYDIWEKDSGTTVYTIEYNANGGLNAPVAQNKQNGVDIKISTEAPSREGYTFLGWATSSDSTTVKYRSGDTYSADASCTLYAVWKVNDGNVTISFDGVLSASNMPSSVSCTKGETVVLPLDRPTYSGWCFIGWNVSGNAADKYYLPGEKITVSENITLKGCWANSSGDGALGNLGWYALYFDANGGSFGDKLTKYSRTTGNFGLIKYANTYSFPDTTNLSRDGYRLHTAVEDLNKVAFFSLNGTQNVNTDNNGYGAVIKEGDIFEVNADVLPYGENLTVYACWDPIVTYNMNDLSNTVLNDFNRITKANNYKVLGLGEYTKYSSSSTENGSRTPDSLNTLIPNREGYSGLTQIPSENQGTEFVCWNTKSDGTGTTYYAGQIIDVTKPMTLYAQWKELHTHVYTATVTKEATCTEKGVKTFTCECGDSYTEDIPALGHTFGEWSVVTPATTTSEGL
ncbi:MAG: InlB B-repeat-containing protein, partial [Clostridia bacterium]|nr:InlB B-repeat-containing protein [Clostridia bacterium]